MSYFVTAPQDLHDMAQAANVLAGLETPRRSTVVGGPDLLPLEYAGRGTPGFTEDAFRGSWVSEDLTLAGVEVLQEMLPMAGLLVVVGEILVQFPEVSQALEELPAPLLAENGAFWWDGSPLG